MFTYKKTFYKKFAGSGIGVNLLWGQGGSQYLAFGGLFRTFFFVIVVTLSFNDVFGKQKVYRRYNRRRTLLTYLNAYFLLYFLENWWHFFLKYSFGEKNVTK